MKPRNVICNALAIVLMVLAAWMAWPSRNVHGNPDMETLTAACHTAAGVEARLYEGNGGATVAYWYTVTARGASLGGERQIFFSYRSPVVDRITCPGDGIVLWSGESSIASLSGAGLAAATDRPIQYWSGQRTDVSGQPFTHFRWAIAAVFVIAAVCLLFYANLPRGTGPTRAA
jgi:hypothetical protein